MLYQFSFKNFKSYREKTIFDMRAENINEFNESILIDKNGEAKELGTGTVLEPDIIKEEKEVNELCFVPEGEFTFNIQTRKYRRKRFKKLLMSRGVERNWAEIYSRWLNRTQFELDMFF